MRIKRFKARRVHGYMDFDVRLHDDLTFLTGINGSGKTTVIRCLYAMIFPSLRMLARMKYESMQVSLRVPGQRRFVTISTKRDESYVSLSSSETDQTLTIPVFPEDLSEGTLQTFERENEYYQEALTRNADNAVLKYIGSLPSPLFLGIERRAIEPTGRRAASYYLRRRSGTDMVSNLQHRSLLEAEYLAREEYSAVQEKQRELTNKLRADILLTALQYEDLDQPEWDRFVEYRPQRIDEINTMIRSVAFDLGLPTRTVDYHLNLFSSKLRSISDTLGDDLTSPERVQEIHRLNDPQKQKAWAEMIINFPHFRRIDTMFEYAKDYLRQSELANERIDQYLSIVNRFLGDSNKEIVFDGKGYLLVRLGKQETVPITSLSSGESQIVIMITHLSFNPEAQRANIFMVDEPELSLHVAWQELFVDAITKANPNLQVILATHAPSIILDRLEKCVDLTR